MRLLAAFCLIGVTATPVMAFELTKAAPKSEVHHLHVPDELDPAVDPYLWCRLQSLGATVSGKDGKPVARMAEKGGDCSALRVKAATDANALLAKAGEDPSTRSKKVDETLKSIDDFAEEMRGAMAATKSRK